MCRIAYIRNFYNTELIHSQPNDLATLTGVLSVVLLSSLLVCFLKCLSGKIIPIKTPTSQPKTSTVYSAVVVS